MKTNKDEYLGKEHDIEGGILHVTKLLVKDYEQEHVTEMMAEQRMPLLFQRKKTLPFGKVKTRSS